MNITRLLHAASAGDRAALDELYPLVYDEFRSRAGALMRRERTDHTLQATAVVNEVYLKLLGEQRLNFADRVHFFAFAASVMRRILTDHARHRNREKRAGGRTREPLDRDESSEEADLDLALDVTQVLEKLEAIDAQRAKIVELRFFGGLTMEQVAHLLSVSLRSAERQWRAGRAWLRRELGE